MAARRALSIIAARISQNPFPKEVSRKFSPSPNTFCCDYAQYTRGFQSLAETSLPCVENPEEKEQTRVKHQVKSKLKVSERHDLVMVFTCTVCDTRSIKTACRESYDKGVVLCRCDGCNNTHLIADRLGWFGEPGSVEEFLAARGEEVKKGSSDTLNLTFEDFAGKKNLDVKVE